MKKFLKIFFGAIWLLVLVFMHLGVASAKVFKSGAGFWWLCIGIWWALSIGTFAVYDKITTAKSEKKRREYEEKYVSEVELEDEFLGKMKFSYDRNTDEMRSLEIHLPPFGADRPDTLYILDYKDENKERIFKALRDVYAHKDEILDIVCPELLETASEYEETDENGGEYTPETMRAVMYACIITVHEAWDGFTVSLECYVTRGTLELGGHGFVADVNFDKKTIDFDMPG